MSKCHKCKCDDCICDLDAGALWDELEEANERIEELEHFIDKECRWEHEGNCKRGCVCGADEHNAKIDRMLGGRP